MVRFVLAVCLSLCPLVAQSVRIPITVVLPDDPNTPQNEGAETLRVLEHWRLTQITGLTEDGRRILTFDSISDILAEELNRYIAAILNDICNTRISDCPEHLRPDFIEAEEVITRKHDNTKGTIRVDYDRIPVEPVIRDGVR